MKLGRSVSVVLGFACLVLAAGCSAGATEETAGGGASAQEANQAGPQQATVRIVTIDETATASKPTEYAKECVVKGKYLEVSGIPSAAATALNGALASRELADFRSGPCEDPYEVETNTEALMNAHGVLSVQSSGNDYYSGAAHPNAWLYGKSYALATGAELKLADVFSDASGKQIVEKVIAALSEGSAEQKAVAEMYGESMRERPEGLGFVLMPQGVSFYFTGYAGHADFAIALEGLTIPYGELRDALEGSSPAAGVWAAAASAR